MEELEDFSDISNLSFHRANGQPLIPKNHANHPWHYLLTLARSYLHNTMTLTINSETAFWFKCVSGGPRIHNPCAIPEVLGPQRTAGMAGEYIYACATPEQLVLMCPRRGIALTQPSILDMGTFQHKVCLVAVSDCGTNVVVLTEYVRRISTFLRLCSSSRE